MKLVKTLVLVFLVFGSLLLSGCSKTEKEFYALQKECASIDTYVDTGEISISLKQLPAEMTEGASIAETFLLQMLNNLKLTYTHKVDRERGLIFSSVYLQLFENSAPQEILSIISKDKMIYIRVDEIAKLLKPLADPDFAPFLDGVDGKKYLTISEDELFASMESDATMQTNSLKNLWDMDKMKAQQDLYYRLFEGLMADVYDQYEMGVVEKKGKKYTITLTAQEIVSLIRPFLVYSVDNVEKLDTFLMSTVENLTDDEMEMLGLDPAKREEYLQGITESINQIKLAGPELITEWDNTQQMVTEEITKTLGTSQITSTLEKTSSNAFDSEMELLLKIHDAEDTEESNTEPIEISLKIKDQVKRSSSFDVSAPTEDLISFTDFQSKLPMIMEIQPTYGFYTYHHGFSQDFSDIETSIQNNHTNVPLRQVAEVFKEKVGWDGDRHQAFVERDKKRIYFTGTIKDNRVFVSLKEFGKLGYQISWDSSTGTATLKK